jgi:hypothetical protein
MWEVILVKTPLRFQMTEFDCGSVSLLNAISYLFEREEIPSELIRLVSVYTLNCYDEKGKLEDQGKSKEARNLLNIWFNELTIRNNFDLHCNLYQGKSVDIDKLKLWLDNDGVAVIKVYKGNSMHYVLLTGIDDRYAYLWDPYYLDQNYYDNESCVTIIFDRPFNYNRKVLLSRFNSEEEKDFSLGLIENREYLLINRGIELII